jgi:hypothetical protein
MKHHKSFLILIISSLIITSCKTAKQSENAAKQTMTTNTNNAGPHAIIYKTTKDYSDNVPVTLSEDKKKVISYPDKGDVFYKGKLAYPTKLENGYLLDNRGISATTAFTKYTYEEYSKLKTTPDTETLFNSIIDANPFTEIIDCGSRYRFKDEVTELNAEIKSGKIKEYPKLK